MNGNIGIFKATEKNSRLFTYHKIDHRVCNVADNIEKIHSTIISKEVIGVEIEECSLWIKNTEKVVYELFIIVDIEYKIVYSLKNDTMLYAINHNHREFIKVRLPIEISKDSIEDFLNKHNICDYINIEDLKLHINNNYISVSGYMLLVLKELEKEELALQLSSEALDNNLFITNSSGDFLEQKTFNLNNNYISVNFYDDKCLYIQKGEINSGLYELDRNSNKERDIEPIGMNLCWTSILHLAHNKYLATYFNSKICTLSDGTGFSLCIIKDNKVINIDNNIVVSEKNTPRLSRDKSSFIYVKRENSSEKLYIYNNILSKNKCLLGTKKILQIQISEDSKYAMVLVMGKKGRNIFISNTINNNIQEISIPIIDCKIKDVYFFNSTKILVVIHRDLRDDLYMYNITEDSFEKLTNNSKGKLISSVMITNIERAIILAIKDTDGYNLYKFEIYSKRLVKLLDLNAKSIEIISKT